MNIFGQSDKADTVGLKGPAVQLKDTKTQTGTTMKAFILLALFAVACEYQFFIF